MVTSKPPEDFGQEDGSSHLFIFLVDRSGSMSGSRMNITKEALNLFLQSLPVGCSFAILGFGSTSAFEVDSNTKK